MRNVTPLGSDLLTQYPKPKMKMLGTPTSAADARKLMDNSFVSAKLDGALTTLAFGKNGVEAYSPRTSKTTGRPIVYTDRLGLVGYKPPKELQGQALKGEVIAMRGKKVLPANEISALMNMNLADMQRRVAAEKIRMQIALFDAPGVPDIHQKIQYLENISKKLPTDKFMIAPYSFDSRDSLKMYDAIKSGVHPLTSEGVVMSPLGNYDPRKLKFRPEFDVVIRNVFPAVTKSGAPRAGGFEYSLPGSGSVIGRVGTGFDHALLQDMLAHPEEYVGRTARVDASEQYGRGTLRAPSFIGLHEDISQKRASYAKFAEIAMTIGAGGHDIQDPTPNGVDKTLWMTLGAIKVYLVNGKEVRTKKSIDFTQGGHWLVFDFIPENEIWIERMLDPQENVYTLGHELDELWDMAFKKKKYAPAHSDANQEELAARFAEQ